MTILYGEVKNKFVRIVGAVTDVTSGTAVVRWEIQREDADTFSDRQLCHDTTPPMIPPQQTLPGGRG
jgi:hypothetical protein